MNLEDMRKVLNEPHILNLILAIFALERTYSLIHTANIAAWGHALAFTGYLIGFIIGIDYSTIWVPYNRQRKWSYGFLIVTSIWGVVAVWCDVFNVEDVDFKICCWIGEALG